MMKGAVPRARRVWAATTTSLRKLPPEQREILILSRIERLTVKQISERTGRTPDSIKYQLSVALRGLKAAFGETDSLHLPDRSLELGSEDNES